MTILYLFFLVYVFWLAFVVAMAAKWQWHTLPTTAKVLVSPVIGVGVGMDVLLQVTFASALFLDPPQELTITQRLDRYEAGSGWRRVAALWICKNLLNPFAVDGHHCSK